MGNGASGSLPLAGLVVVEFATFVAGPSAGLALAQLGADVVRIDPLGGGLDLHRWPRAASGESLYWTGLNRGKRSVTLDVRSEAGREIALRLICAPGPDRGIFIDNQVGQSWLSWSELAQRRADLIHVHIDGHRDGRPAVDYTVNAEVGLPLITGPENAAGPVNHVLPAWDMVAGMSATTALLAALRHRDRTGSGAKVNIALADVALSWVANFGWLSEAGQLATDRDHQGNYLYGSYGRDFATSDGRHVMVVALTPHQWRSLVSVTGSQLEIESIERRHGVDLLIEDARYEHREEITEALTGWFAGLDSGAVAERLTAARVLWAPYRTLREAADAGEGPLRPINQPGIGTVISAESPMRWDGVDPQVSPASPIGADTYNALAELAGVTDVEFAELVDAGVIAPQDSLDG